MNWLANFCVVITCPVMFTNIKYQTYATYAVINFAIIPTIYFVYPETKGPTLEEISKIFDGEGAVAHIDMNAVEKEIHEDRLDNIDEKNVSRVEHSRV